MQTTIQNSYELNLLQFAGMHLRHTEALARATGERFNIFNVLGIGHYEVKTHSPILAELLNPDGFHGQGDKFLQLFVSERHFNVPGFGAGKTTVEQNYYAGAVTENSGGLIDVVVKNNSCPMIAIENKIYAADGENQMKRYRNSLPNVRLFYLTLDGREPSNLSHDELKRLRVEPISYGADILHWLEDCRKEAACLPHVRETISQYIHLIQKLTKQTTYSPMNSELIEHILEKKESLAAFYELQKSLGSVWAGLIARLDAQLNQIVNATGLERAGKVPLGDLERKDSGFYFSSPRLENCKLKIGFEFENNYFGNFFFGFATVMPEHECPVRKQIQKAFAERFPEMANDPDNRYWAAWSYWDPPYRHWKEEAWEAIRSGEFAQVLKARLEALAEIARQVCPDTIQPYTAVTKPPASPA